MSTKSTSPARLVLALMILSALALVGAGLAQVRIDTGIGSFVPRGDDAFSELTDRDRDFGGDPVVVLLRGTSQNGLLLDPDQLTRLVRLEGELARIPDAAVVYGPGTVLNQTATAVRNMLLRVSGSRDVIENTARAQARARGMAPAATQDLVDRALAAFDRRYGALVTQAMPMGLPSVRNGRFVASVLLGPEGEPRPEWRFLVPTAKSATILIRPREGIDQQGARRLVERVERAVDRAGLKVDEPVVTGVPALTSAVSDRAAAEAPRIGVLALSAVGAVYLLVPWSRRRRDRLRPLLAATLGTATTVALFGWLDRPLSLGVVAFLPIVLGIGSDFPLYLSQPDQRRRVLVAAGGAAAAFATLAVSELPFVREFGLALAVGVVATVAWALALGRGLSHVAPARVDEPPTPGTARIPRVVAVGCAALAVLASGIGWAMLPGQQVESSPQELARGLSELDDVSRAEGALGFSGEISVVVRGRDVLSPEVLAWSESAEEALVTAHGDELRPLLTLGRLLDFLGEDATAEQVTEGSSLLPPYLLNAVVTGRQDVASSSYGIRLRDIDDQRDLIRSVRELLPAAPEGYDVEVVGLPVVATSGLDAMSSSRYLIGVLGLLAAVVVVGAGLRSLRLALMVGVSSLMAAGWVYLGVSLTGQGLTPLTLAVGALITVTACEFTVMLDSARGRVGAWTRRSVLVAASAGTLGYLCLSLSELAVLRTFGLVLAAGVAASYVASRAVVSLVRSRSLAPAATGVGSNHELTEGGHPRGAPSQKECVS